MKAATRAITLIAAKAALMFLILYLGLKTEAIQKP